MNTDPEFDLTEHVADVTAAASKVLACIKRGYWVERGHMDQDIPDALTALLALAEEQAATIARVRAEADAFAEQPDTMECGGSVAQSTGGTA